MRAFDRIKEAFDWIAKDEVEKMRIVQEIMLKSTDFLRRIIAPRRRTRRCHNVVRVPELQQFLFGGLRLVGHCRKQGMCENLINPLKLLANQQEDGDGLLQNMLQTSAKEAGKVSRTACDTSSRCITTALGCGELHRGTGTFEDRKPKFPEGGSDVTFMESPDELKLRAEEVDTSKAYIDVNHIKLERWPSPV